jgi:hypothetical protein
MIEDTKEFEIYEAKETYASEINENWYDEQFECDVDDPSFYGSEW